MLAGSLKTTYSGDEILSAIQRDLRRFRHRALAIKPRDLHDVYPPAPAADEICRLVESAKAAMPFYTDLTAKPVYPLLSNIFDPTSAPLSRELEFLAWLAVRSEPAYDQHFGDERAAFELELAFDLLLRFPKRIGLKSEAEALGAAFDTFAKAVGLISTPVRPDPKDAFNELLRQMKQMSRALSEKEDEIVCKRRSSRGCNEFDEIEYTVKEKNGHRLFIHYYNDGTTLRHFTEPDAFYRTFTIVKNASALYARKRYEADHAQVKHDTPTKSELTKLFLSAARDTQKLAKESAAAADRYLGRKHSLIRRRLAPVIDPGNVPYLLPLRCLCGTLTSPEIQTAEFQQAFAILDAGVSAILDNVVKAIPKDDDASTPAVRLSETWREFLQQTYQALRFGFAGNAIQRMTSAFDLFTQQIHKAECAVGEFEWRFNEEQKRKKKSSPPPAESPTKETGEKILAELMEFHREFKRHDNRSVNMDRKADRAHKKAQVHYDNVDNDRPTREYKKPDSTVKMIKHGLKILSDAPDTAINKVATATVEWAMKQGIIPRIPKTDKAYGKKVAVINTTLSRAWAKAKRPPINPQP